MRAPCVCIGIRSPERVFFFFFNLQFQNFSDGPVTKTQCLGPGLIPGMRNRSHVP